ncbi:MAG: hypothetical protein ACOZNI_20380 [Myxococcota bacterium]
MELEALPLEREIELLDKPAEYAALGDVAVRSDEVGEEDEAGGHAHP